MPGYCGAGGTPDYLSGGIQEKNSLLKPPPERLGLRGTRLPPSDPCLLALPDRAPAGAPPQHWVRARRATPPPL